MDLLLLTMTGQKVTLGAEVRRYRKHADMSQERLAEQVGVTREAISKIERGATVRPSNELLQKLEEVLGLSRKYAYELIGEYEEDPDFSPDLAMLRLADLPTHEDRMKGWKRLPVEYRRAVRRVMADVLRDIAEQLEEEDELLVDPPS